MRNDAHALRVSVRNENSDRVRSSRVNDWTEVYDLR